METYKEKILKAQGLLRRMAMSLTRDKDDAHDLTQDTILKLLDNELKYTEQSNFSGWALMVMKNLFLNNYRKVAKFQKETDFVAVDNISVAFDETPESVMGHKEISKVVNNLPTIYKRPIVLYLQGYSYGEIAEKLNLPIGTVKSRIFTVRKKLEAILK